ncbi:gamma-glutamyltransferase [Gloeobacter kilaueensis]|uniref:Glutathione hydrolase proenzyme n=1 Tax=Gloeobacter kilaueensis (strain ATCC BAA-2537 / CCAP 1431/1 / ULC 316 / JS1) TaxID=1183438 RepID=U5QI54_GLOK1|nr:gamma-glutamyltransferase [Gloeobacter kilaueensis]AGY57310.1 gamma-glutamyltransferase [Gloeobacter kilaueensis JS1]
MPLNYRLGGRLAIAALAALPFAAAARAESGAVSTAHPLATAAGIEMLRKGGNAFDAAIAASLVLGVVEPQASGLGGGGFALFYTGRTHQARVLDFRETAPARASASMYLDAAGKVIPRLSLDGYLAVAVPGQAAGLLRLQQTSGSLPLAEVAAPAIRLARDGFAVSPLLHERLEASASRLRRDPEASRIFLVNNQAPAAGYLLKQPDLARTIEAWVQTRGASFYRGQTAQALARAMTAHGALVSTNDLGAYIPLWRDPLRGSYRGTEMLTMPPPGSGTVLLEMLGIVENFDLPTQPLPLRAHFTAQAMSRAYADRSRFLGDPAFVPVPVAALIARSYGIAQKATIDPARATPSSAITPGSLLDRSTLAAFTSWEGPRPVENTSHLSTIDSDGNAVSITQTINGGFGAGVVAPGTGILLNNEMDDFAAAPGVPNLFGLIGSKANAIAPGKRPLSSMTPTILLKDGRPWVVLGSPGGSFITNAVLQTVLNLLDYKLPLAEAVNAPRLHHQWQPDRLLVEADFPVPTSTLSDLGYQVVPIDAMGNVEAVQAQPDPAVPFVAASDRRREGTSALWIAPARPLVPKKAEKQPAASRLPNR